MAQRMLWRRALPRRTVVESRFYNHNSRWLQTTSTDQPVSVVYRTAASAASSRRPDDFVKQAIQKMLHDESTTSSSNNHNNVNHNNNAVSQESLKHSILLFQKSIQHAKEMVMDCHELLLLQSQPPNDTNKETDNTDNNALEVFREEYHQAEQALELALCHYVDVLDTLRLVTDQRPVIMNPSYQLISKNNTTTNDENGPSPTLALKDLRQELDVLWRHYQPHEEDK